MRAFIDPYHEDPSQLAMATTRDRGPLVACKNDSNLLPLLGRPSKRPVSKYLEDINSPNLTITPLYTYGGALTL